MTIYLTYWNLLWNRFAFMEAAMSKIGKFWALLGILLLILTNYPFLKIFNRDTLVCGIPIILFYLFWVWIIAVVALFTLGRVLKRPK